MSVTVRHLTNGTKSGYLVINNMTDEKHWYDNLEAVPKDIYDFAVHRPTPSLIGPEGARILGAKEFLYPDFKIICGYKEYKGTPCIAEACKFAQNQDYTKCSFAKMQSL